MSRVAETASDNIIKILILNGAYRASVAAIVVVRRDEFVAEEVHAVRVLFKIRFKVIKVNLPLKPFKLSTFQTFYPL